MKPQRIYLSSEELVQSTWEETVYTGRNCTAVERRYTGRCLTSNSKDKPSPGLYMQKNNLASEEK